MDEPKMIPGGIAVDDRGSLTFCNDFDFEKVKRFYQVENVSKDVVRAFHGHLKEGKYVFVPKGSVKIYLAKVKWVKEGGKDYIAKIVKIKHDNPHIKNDYVLSSKKPTIFWIPPGYANGFKCLEEGTIVQFFSTSTLEESRFDDQRFEWDVFGEDIWKTENR